MRLAILLDYNASRVKYPMDGALMEAGVAGLFLCEIIAHA